MPGSGECPAQQAAPIIGREAGLARLRGLVDPVPQASQVLVVTGEAGMGKTVLLADAAGRALSAGMRVLSGQDRARRLAAAASMAVPTGQADWVQDRDREHGHGGGGGSQEQPPDQMSGRRRVLDQRKMAGAIAVVDRQAAGGPAKAPAALPRRQGPSFACWPGVRPEVPQWPRPGAPPWT
jgi:hypothetical protein